MSLGHPELIEYTATKGATIGFCARAQQPDPRRPWRPLQHRCVRPDLDAAHPSDDFQGVYRKAWHQRP
ncbi:hypothetical protein BKA93DRAFT_821183 [Sparassis latifolia]|uniref:Uncharacterized protein n=1 Tax=Sparassis crispa TaxID=139825 RepID=A0A401G6K7_9APHY|nr:hypothetical protein SCP_0106660 [Sparassis crispa]GBE77784.1 hypothetical protein SCP_0106660 [Sparassis crispa]